LARITDCSRKSTREIEPANVSSISTTKKQFAQ